MSQSSRALAALLVTSALSSRFVSKIKPFKLVRGAAFALVASTALMLPSIALAAMPAPKFIDGMDDHGVDLVSGLPYLAIEEGGIGSGPGRIAMQRIWAEGAGWVDNWSGGLFVNGGKTYVQIAGISERFTLLNGVYTNDEGDGTTLVNVNGGNLLFTARDGTTINFYPSNQNALAYSCPGADPATCQVPTDIVRPNGTKFHLTWVAWNQCLSPPPSGETCSDVQVYQRLQSISSSAGYSLNIGYAANTPSGVYQNTAPPAGWFQRGTIGFDNSVNHPNPGVAITYAYPSSTELDVTDPAGRTWKFTTDSSNRIIGVQRPGSSAPNISYVYGADGTVNSTMKDGVTNTYGRLISGSTATETVTDPLGKQTIVTSDLNAGRPTSVKDPLSHTTSYTYDTNARLTKITAPEGNSVQYAYDGRGNVTTITSVAKSGSGLANIVTSASFDTTCTNIVKCNEPNSTTDAKNNTISYTYDPTHGGVLTVTQPAPTTGAVQPQTRYSYTQVTSASGDLVYMLTGISACQTSASCTGTSDETKDSASYNSNLLPTSVSQSDGTGALIAATTGTYDSHGNISTVTGPLGAAQTAKYRYDAADQLIGVTSPDPDGSGPLPMPAIKYSYNPDGTLWLTQFGTVVDQSDTAWSNFAEIYHHYRQFDGNARVIRETLWSNNVDYAVVDHLYDSLGRLSCSVTYMDSTKWGSQATSCTPLQTTGPNGPDRVTQTLYDAAGEILQNLVGVGTSTAATETTLTYNPNGTVASLADGNNNVTSYTYDGFDRLSKTTYPGGTTDQVTLYDANGNANKRVNRAGQNFTFAYDALNRLTSKSGAVPQVNYTYDNLNRMLSATFATSGLGVSNSFDALSRLTSTTSTMSGTGKTLSYQYDLEGRRTRLTHPDGIYFTLSYDGLDRLTNGTWTTSGGTTQFLAITYNASGLRSDINRASSWSHYTYDAVERLATNVQSFAGTGNNLTETFSYSPSSQISSQSRDNDAFAYAGSMDVNRNYAANGLNQYTTVGPATYGYDANGNVTSDGANTYAYDAENRLVSATQGSVTASLSYDPLGRLWQVTTHQTNKADTTARFLYDGDQLAAEYDGSGNMTRRFMFAGEDEPILEDAGGALNCSGTHFLHNNYQGSIIALADCSGNRTNVNTYDEYGMPGASNQGRLQYTGQMYLPEIGMYYYKARMYSTMLGRFMQTDPIGYNDGPNWYAYTHNDPVNGTDPTGLDPNEIVVPGVRILPIEPGPGEPGHDLGFGSGPLGTPGGGPGDLNYGGGPGCRGNCNPIVITPRPPSSPGSAPFSWTGRSWEPDPKYRDPTHCAVQAIGKNALGLTLDTLGLVANALASEYTVPAAIAGAAIGAVGFGAGFAGHGNRALQYVGIASAYVGGKSSVAVGLSVGARAAGRIGWAALATSTVIDVMGTADDYKKCRDAGG